jgi:hypothetical protein
MSEMILATLLEADAQLAAQTDELTAALDTVQERLKGIHAVIALYQPSEAGAETAPAPTIAPEVKPQPAKATKARPSAKVKSAARPGGRTAEWHQYLQEGFQSTPLPEVVKAVLQTRPRGVFKIADVMERMFIEEIPKAQYLNARNRISNILSSGARGGEWHHGSKGTYSLSAKAIKVA